MKENLKKLRIEKGLTQKTMCEMLSVSHNCYASYEQGRTEPNVQTLIKLAEIFEVSVDYLIGKTDDVGFMPAQTSSEFSSAERELIKKVRSLSPFDRELVVAQINRLAKDSVKI